MSEKYNFSQAVRLLEIPKLGRNKLYKLLRDLGIIDCQNRPAQKYVSAGILVLGSPRSYFHRYVTLVVDRRGLLFLSLVTREYLHCHPMPTFPRKKK